MQSDPSRELRHPPISEAAESPPRRLGRRGQLLGSLVALLLVAGLAGLAWYLTRQPAAPANGAAFGPGRGGPATTVGVAVAELTDIPVTLDALGTVVPLATVRVRPQVSGVLQQVHYREGQSVRAGELLASIDARQFEAALQQATGQRMRDEAQLDAARVTLQRFRTLLAQDSIARQEVDTQAALVKQLEAAIVVSRANEAAARLDLGYTRVASPIAGRVGLRTVDVGNVVGPSDANGIAVVTQLSPIDVEFAIPQDRIDALLQGGRGEALPVRALDSTRRRELETGRFISLDNQVDVQTGTVRAKARFDNAGQALFPNQFVNVQLRLRTIEGAVTVPLSAVRTGANGDYVFVLKDDRTVQLRNVRRGEATAERVQITSGLQAGERVVTEGADRLRDGSRVVLPGEGPAAAAGAPGNGTPAAASARPRRAASGPQQRRSAGGGAAQ
ncbi:efflux RND transporter periplasmic adaptor subunit [Ramlibacter sp.]|uniref:efflux RND transporter periplasmic adaptor subunit n=1 Tax=Ramlibacter sp. TaxID=1917967 RepID=UPI002FCC2F44